MSLPLAGVPAGAEHGLPTEHDFFAELPVVLSATRLQQPVADAPAAVTIIDRQLIEASGARELVDILRLVPGMLVGRHNSHEPIVSYGGLGERYSRRMQVLVDGRSVYQPFSGGVLWTDLGLAIEDIQHIEVIRGPNAAAYGPSSFLAIINIVTRHPAETRGRHVTTRLGDNGVRDLIGRQSGSHGDLDYRLTLSTQQDDGFPDVNGDKRAHFANLRADYRLTSEHTLSTLAGFGQSRKGMGRPGEEFDPERHFTTDSGHVHLRLDQDAGTGESWTLQYYYQQNDTVDEFRTGDFTVEVAPGVFVPIDGVPINQNLRTHRHDLEFERRQTLTPGTRVVWGGGLRHDRVESTTYFSERSPATDDLYRAFANLEQGLGPNTVLNLGAAYEHSDLIGDQFSPRAALNVHVHPEHTLRLVAARATRTPVLIEEIGLESYTADFGILGEQTVVIIDAEGGLRPETIMYYEAGHHAVFPDSGVTLDTKLFHARVRDLVVGARRTERNVLGDGLRSFRNRGGVAYQGIETQVDYRLGPRTRLHGGLTYHFNRDDHSEQRDGRFARAIPEHILTAALTSQVTGRLRLSGTYYYYSEIDWIDGAPSDAYDGFLDLSAQWTLNRHARLTLTAQDVLARGYDTRTPEDSDIYQVNRRETHGFAALSVDF
jgi:iron complex outermembrane recepter protein